MKNIIAANPSRFPLPHPLKEEFKKRKIPLWYLRKCTTVSEFRLSRYFNNIDNMPSDLEIKLYRLLDILNGDGSSLNENRSCHSSNTLHNADDDNDK